MNMNVSRCTILWVQPPVTTVVLKFSCLHCDGCIQKIRKIITKTKGCLFYNPFA